MSKAVYFTYGRMNPPTTGHEMLIKEMIKMGDDPEIGAPVYIFTSHSEDDFPKKRPRKTPGKNPLSVAYKKGLLRKVVKKINKKRSPIILSTSKKTNFHRRRWSINGTKRPLHRRLGIISLAQNMTLIFVSFCT